jgi:hypothetical protein
MSSSHTNTQMRIKLTYKCQQRNVTILVGLNVICLFEARVLRIGHATRSPAILFSSGSVNDATSTCFDLE